jgi:hypothetical protein
MELLEIASVEFSLTKLLLIRFYDTSDAGGKMITMKLNVSYISSSSSSSIPVAPTWSLGHP